MAAEAEGTDTIKEQAPKELNDTTEDLISCIQELPILYNNGRADYKDSVKKENAWKAVARTLGHTGTLQI